MNKQKTHPAFVFRQASGFVGGFVGGLSLLTVTFMTGPIYIIGPIIFGQFLLFEQSIFYVIHSFFYNKMILYVLGFVIAFIAFSSVWGLIGVLLVSMEKKQKVAGWLLVLLYIIAGYISFQIFGSSIISN